VSDVRARTSAPTSVQRTSPPAGVRGSRWDRSFAPSRPWPRRPPRGDDGV